MSGNEGVHFCGFIIFVYSQTTLSTGELAIIGLDTPGEDFAFVPFVNLEVGTEIYFTDEEADGDYNIGTGEGTVLYTAPAGGVSAGTVLTFVGNDNFSVTSDGIFLLGNSGDGLLAYQGSNVGSVSTFLHAIGEDSGDLGTFPDGFSNFMTLGADDGEYNGVRTGTAEELMTAININTSWTTSGSGVIPFVTTPFTVTGGSSATLTISPAGLIETNLNEASISLLLENETFSGFDAGDITLHNAPTGTTVNSVSNSGDNNRTVTLAFDGTDFDSNISDFNITVAATGLVGDDPVTSDNLSITALQETIALSASSLSGFTYIIDNGPSDEQTFTVEGTELKGNIVIIAPTNYEISESSSSGFSSSIPLTPSDGSVTVTTIYVRLEAGLPENTTYDGDITLTSTGADSKIVSCSGSVTDGMGGGTETFANFSETGSSYVSGSFTGQDGSTWTYTQCRGDQTITGPAPCLGKARTPVGSVNSGLISGGIGTLSFDYRQAFSSNVNLNILVNDVLKGNVTSDGQSGIVLNSGTITVNQTGDFVLKFVQVNTSSGQVSIDNVIWTGLSDDVNIPPSISSIAHNPSDVITSSTTVSVSAEVTDSDGTITGVELHWGTSTGNLGTTIAMSNTSGATYTTDFDIHSQSDGVTVYYEIEATDDEPDVTTSSEQSYSINDPAATEVPYGEDFDSGFGDIYTYDVAGNASWTYNSDNHYVSINGHFDTADEDWLILPGIDFSAYSNVNMTFDLWWQYGNQDTDNYLKLLYSTDYIGLGDPSGSSWIELAFAVPEELTSTETSVTLASLPSEEIYIAFKYVSADAARAWQIDGISITESISSVVDPSLFTASAAGTDQIDLSWTENTSGNDVLIAWNSSDTFGTPVNGSPYSNSDPITGGGTALGTDSDEAYSHTSLTANTQYFYKIWSADESNNYSEGIISNASTYKEEPSNQAASFSATANGTDEINLAWTDNDGAVIVDGFLVLANQSGTFSNPLDGTAQDDDYDLSDGSAIRNIDHGTQGCSFSGLTAATTYYFTIFAYTNSGTTIDYYLTGVPTFNADTEEESEYMPLFISEVADPADDYNSRFVEIFNPNDSSVDFSTGQWYLSRQANGVNIADIELTGTINPNGVYVVTNTSSVISYYNLQSGNISGSGDDGYFLYYGGDHSSGTLVDAYGVIDVDGTDEAWEYTDSQAERIDAIASPNSIWTASEWSITGANLGNMSPGSHTQSGILHQTQNMGGGDSETFPSGGTEDITINIDGAETGTVQVAVSISNQNYQGASNTYSGWWDIDINGNSEGVTFIFTYDEAELNGINELKLAIFHLSGSVWENLGGFVDVGNNTITLSNYTGSFSPFTLGDTGTTILPITLSSFTANYSSSQAILQWVTLSEMNNAYWNIYRSDDNELALSQQINTELISGHGTTSETSHYSFNDEYELVEGSSYFYWLESISYSGNIDQYGPVMLTVPIEEEEESPEVPEQYGLLSNYPNPFNPNTMIRYNLPVSAEIVLTIYNIKGEKIKTLDKGNKSAGYYQISWDGTNMNNEQVSSGVYFYELATPNYVKSRSMLLIK